MVKRISLAILLILISFSSSAEIEKKGQPIKPDQLNKLRANARNKNFKTPKRNRTIPQSEITSLLSRNPGQATLEAARKIQLESESYHDNIEELILNCFLVLNDYESAVSQARKILIRNESKLAHRVLFLSSLEKKEWDNAGFHLSRADFGFFSIAFYRAMLFYHDGNSGFLFWFVTLIVFMVFFFLIRFLSGLLKKSLLTETRLSRHCTSKKEISIDTSILVFKFPPRKTEKLDGKEFNDYFLKEAFEFSPIAISPSNMSHQAEKKNLV